MIKISNNAMRQWNQIPTNIQAKILNNVYCLNCSDTVRIKDFILNLDKSKDLILKGKCSNCNCNVARLI